MQYAAVPGQMNSIPIVNGLGVYDAQMGQRESLSPLDVMQLRKMYGCDHTGPFPCANDDAGVGQILKFSGIPATCAQLAGLCEGVYKRVIVYFCPLTCHACPSIT